MHADDLHISDVKIQGGGGYMSRSTLTGVMKLYSTCINYVSHMYFIHVKNVYSVNMTISYMYRYTCMCTLNMQ